MTESQQEADLARVVDLIDLESIKTFALSGQLLEQDLEGPPASDESGESEWKMRLLANQTDEHLAVRAMGNTTNSQISVEVDMAVIYRKQEAFSIEDEVLAGFIGKVAIMSLYPYIRQAVYDISSRLGNPITLRLIKQSEVALEEYEGDPYDQTTE